MSKIPNFIRNVATLASGGVVSNVIAVVSIPLISRLFIPTDYGVAALFISIITVLVVLATLRYEHAIVLPDNDDDALDIVTLALLVSLIVTIVLIVIISSAYFLFPSTPWIEKLDIWFVAIPGGVFLLSLVNIFVSYNTRIKAFKKIAIADIGNASVMSGSRITSGILYGSSVGLLIMSVLLAYGFKLFLLTRKLYGFLIANAVLMDFNKIKHLTSKYSQFPKYSMPTGMLMALGQNMPVFFLAIMFSDSVVGLFAMAYRLMQLPVSLISESVRRTYLQKAADLHNRKISLVPTLLKTTLVLVFLGVLIFLPLAFWGKEVLALGLGEKWGGAGTYVAILCPWFISMFMRATPSVLYIIYQRQDVLLKIHIVATTIMFTIFMLANWLDATPEKTLIAVSVIGTITNIIITGVGIRLANNNSLHTTTSY